jgi:hypothetical protein
MNVSHVAECPDLGPECNEPVEPTPYNHHVEEFIFETGLTAGFAITDFFEIETRWALRVVDVNPTYTELDGSEKLVPNDIHHHDETLVDVTDPWLLGRFAHVNGDFIGSMQLGMSFPVGRTEEDPYQLGQEGLSHQHLQAGTGTVVPIVGVALGYTIQPVTIGLSGIAFVSAYENDEGFRAPSRLYASHRVSVSFLEGVLRPFVGLDLSHETEEYWQGEPGLEGSNVRTELFGSTGLAYMFKEPWTVDLSIRGRVAQLTDAATFEIPLMVNVGMQTSFDLWKPKPDAPASPTGPKIEERIERGTTVYEKK